MDEIIKNNEYEVYDKEINISFFNQIIAFIHNTTSNKRENNVYGAISKKCIWNRYDDDKYIKEKCKFQYLGELLERYEERIGNDIRDIRAIAIALGYATNFIENDMFIGTQLIDFINKIKKLAVNDIYLKSALYLYDNQKFYIYGEELLNKEYKDTAEIIFSMSVFYERMEEFFKKNRKQIIELLGKNRNMSAIGNVRVYAWTIENLYPILNKDRKKDVVLLKALIKLPTGFQKEDSNVYKELINNRYSPKEIAYLNYLLLYYKPVPKSVQVGYSLVEEKIATNLCETLINSKETHHENIYELIKKLLQKYDKYQIKCYGYKGIKEALEYKINVVNPITFTELYYDLNEKLFSFNILNEKWNIVASRMESNKYRELFDNFLILSNYDKEKLEECISTYNILTNTDYIASFLKYDWNRYSIFSFLVNKGVILLKDIYEMNLKTNPEKGNAYLKKYIEGINNKRAFDFLKYILRLNKYNIEEINKIGFNFEELSDTYEYYYRENSTFWNTNKQFLNLKNNKILLDCLEKYIFYSRPEVYFEFVKKALNSDIVCKLYKKEELRKVYFALCEIDPATYKTEEYQKRYLTVEELEEIYNEKRIQEELEREKKLQETKEYISNEFKKLEEKNSFQSLYSFCEKYDRSEIYIEISTQLVKKYILKNIKGFDRNIEEIFEFIKLMEILINENQLTSSEFAKIAFEYTKLEVEENELINTAYRVND